MGYTKRQIIEQAFEEIGLASYVFDLTPEQIQSALRRLDLMVSSWQSLNIQIGFPLPVNPYDSDINEEIQTSDNDNEALVLNLAVRIAPSYGKSVPPETRVIAKHLYNQLLIKAATPYEQQYMVTLPLGAGHKGTDQVFVTTSNLDPLNIGENGQLVFKNS